MNELFFLFCLFRIQYIKEKKKETFFFIKRYETYIFFSKLNRTHIHFICKLFDITFSIIVFLKKV